MSRCLAAAGSGCRSSRARGSAGHGRSSPSTSSRRSARWRPAPAPPRFVDGAEVDPVKAVRALTGGLGVDHAFEAVGKAKLVRQAIEAWRSAAPRQSSGCCRPMR